MRSDRLEMPEHPLVPRRHFSKDEIDRTGRERHRREDVEGRRLESEALMAFYLGSEESEPGCYYVSASGTTYVVPVDEHGQPMFPPCEGESLR